MSHFELCRSAWDVSNYFEPLLPTHDMRCFSFVRMGYIILDELFTSYVVCVDLSATGASGRNARTYLSKGTKRNRSKNHRHRSLGLRQSARWPCHHLHRYCLSTRG